MKALFDLFGESPVGVWLRESQIWFPLFEMLHLAGLGVLLGSIVLLNGRFFGLGLRRETVAEVAEDLAPWTRLSLVVMAISGFMLFCAKAPDLSGMDQGVFLTKMGLIAVGVVFHYRVQVPQARKQNFGAGRLAAAVSLLIWFGAAIVGLSLEFL
ncbi:MAG: hypothetical protein RL328_1615 [Acidobacteriota bacterium]